MTKTKKQLRAEAVERLKNCVAARFDAESIVIALTSGRHGQSDWSLECDKLIYLLTDDDSTISEDDSTAERGMTNLEWLYEHDEYLNSFAKLMACLRGFSTDEFTANEWLRQEHSEPNPDCSAMLYRMYTENMKQEPCSHYEPKDDAVSIMRECAETGHSMRVLRGRLGVECVTGWQARCLGKLADMVERDYVRRESVEEVMGNDRALVEENAKLASELEAAKLQIGQSDAPKSVETSENPASKCEISDFEDSRDKLEADIRQYANPEGNTGTLGACWERKMLEFLDRQAAITERETKLRELYKFEENHREHIRSLEETNRKLNERIDELKAERDELQEQLRIGWECECRLQAERDKFKEANDYHAAQYELASEDCDRLQAQVDELTAERDNLKANNQQLHTLAGEQTAMIDELQKQVDEQTNAGRKMSTELANMQDYITKVRAGRERYRSMCSEMATKIHDALMVMDEGMA